MTGVTGARFQSRGVTRMAEMELELSDRPDVALLQCLLIAFVRGDAKFAAKIAWKAGMIGLDIALDEEVLRAQIRKRSPRAAVL